MSKSPFFNAERTKKHYSNSGKTLPSLEYTTTYHIHANRRYADSVYTDFRKVRLTSIRISKSV